MKTDFLFHKNTDDVNDHSNSKRPQRIHHSHDDSHCDSSSANDADVDNNKHDGGKQQRNTMQQQHSSAAIKTTHFGTTPMRTTASPFLAETQQQPAARKVFTATAHPFKPSCQAIPAAAKSAAARRRDKGSTASATATTPELSPNEFNAQDWLSSKVLILSSPSRSPAMIQTSGLRGDYTETERPSKRH